MGDLGGILDGWQHACEHFEAKVFLVAQSVCTALDDADLVVESFNESERDLIFGLAVGGDPSPMTLNHFGELLVGRKRLPFQARPPVLEEAPRPTFGVVVPELAEGFLEPASPVEPVVGREQFHLGKAYPSHSRRCRFAGLAIPKSSQLQALSETGENVHPHGPLGDLPLNLPTRLPDWTEATARDLKAALVKKQDSLIVQLSYLNNLNADNLLDINALHADFSCVKKLCCASIKNAGRCVS